MNKLLKTIGAAGLMGAMLMFAGCGGGGDSAPAQSVDTTPPPATTLITAAGTASAAGVNKTFAFGAGTFTYSIAGFGAGDVLSFPVVAGSVPTVKNDLYTDGKVVVEYTTASPNQTITVELTGVSAADDAKLNFLADFGTVYGAGTVKYQ